ncbi:ribonucleotide-diphosphate reductase subunit alpha, partial [Streptococcus suis]
SLGSDVSCILVSTNIVNFMKSPDFGRSVRTMTRALSYVTDHSHISAGPSIEAVNSQAHSIGIGAIGLHSYLAQNFI